MAAAEALSRKLVAVGTELGMEVRTVLSDGSQPVGRGIGPALEATDVMAVLQRDPAAPADLRERALLLAALVLEMAGKAGPGEGGALARAVLDDGRALARFLAICEAQGGLRVPPRATHRFELTAHVAGRVAAIDIRGVASAAKLAGAPRDPAAGAYLHARLGDLVERGQPLLSLHAQSPGELQYAASYLRAQLPVLRIEAPAS